VNAAVLAIYLAGGNTRRLRGALGPLLHGAPLSRSAVSRIVATLKGSLDAWLTQPLADREVVFAYLDALMLRVRSAGKVVSAPVLAVVGVLAAGQKVLLTLELCSGGESYEAWKGCLDGLGARGLPAPLLAIIDGHAGLRRAVAEVWPRAAVQRCCVHKLRNMERKAPKHALAEVREDFHAIVYAASADAARTAWAKFERVWGKRCPGVVKSLQEGGIELLTFFSFPKAQWKTLRTTNVIERLNEEFRRRVKTQGALPTEDSALILLFGLVATGQITLRKLDGYQQLAAVIRQRMRPAA
jgi:transposase-like protein